jgi:hypothetical protein
MRTELMADHNERRGRDTAATCGLSVQVVDLNPKAVKTEELYGFISMQTRDWKDGLLSKVMRDLGQIPNENPKWILLDGTTFAYDAGAHAKL